MHSLYNTRSTCDVKCTPKLSCDHLHHRHTRTVSPRRNLRSLEEQNQHIQQQPHKISPPNQSYVGSRHGYAKTKYYSHTQNDIFVWSTDDDVHTTLYITTWHMYSADVYIAHPYIHTPHDPHMRIFSIVTQSDNHQINFQHAQLQFGI